MFSALAAAIYFVISALLAFPFTRAFGTRILEENGPIEMASFVMMTAAGVLGLVVVWRRRSRLSRVNVALLSLCAFGFFVIGMEEISWGQQLIGFETPEAFVEFNYQEETNWHNHHRLQHFLEVFAIMFALAGLVGVTLARLGVNRQLMPRPFMFWWFAPLLVVASLDLMHEFWIPSRQFDNLVNALDEVNEMICAMCALTFIEIKRRELAG